MLFIRSLLYFIGSLIIVIMIAIAGLLTFFLPFNYRYKIISLWAKFCIWWLSITCNLKVKIIGREHIPSTACVVVSNHQSTWETLALQTILPTQTWVLKKELLLIPIFGWGLALLKPIVINRGNKINAIKKVTTQGVARLKQGIWVIIFPEGTRQSYGKLGKYQNGGIAIAKQAGVDVLPIYHNAGKFWAKGCFIKKSGVITVVIGKKLSVVDKQPAELSDDIRNWSLNTAETLAR